MTLETAAGRSGRAARSRAREQTTSSPRGAFDGTEEHVSGATDSLKRLLIGRVLASNRLGETLLPKKLALPVFCSDPISSVAYATEQIVLVLGTAGTASFLGLSAPISVAVALLLAVVVASYRQTCFAYPSGGAPMS